MSKKESKYHNIMISNENYFILKSMGQTAESFNDVITRILQEKKSLSQGIGVGTPDLKISSSSNHMGMRDPQGD
jgi:predicted CopG family antitoxin